MTIRTKAATSLLVAWSVGLCVGLNPSQAYHASENEPRVAPVMQDETLYDATPLLVSEKEEARAWAMEKGLWNDNYTGQDRVTYAHLAKVLSTYIEGQPLPQSSPQWSDNAFRYMDVYGTSLTKDWEIKRNSPVSRGEFATILNQVLTGENKLNESISFFYESGLSTKETWKGGWIYEAFGASQHLTKDQASLFLYRADRLFEKEIKKPKQVEKLSASILSSVGSIRKLSEEDLAYLGHAVVYATAIQPDFDYDIALTMPLDEALSMIFDSKGQGTKLSVHRLLKPHGTFENLSMHYYQKLSKI